MAASAVTLCGCVCVCGCALLECVDLFVYIYCICMFFMTQLRLPPEQNKRFCEGLCLVLNLRVCPNLCALERRRPWTEPAFVK